MSFKIEDFDLRDNEDFDSYEKRCFIQKKNSDITWNQLSGIMNYNLNQCKSESYYRKKCSRMYREGLLTETKSDENELSDVLKDLIRETKKERFKLSEERTQNNAYIRKLSREETLKEIAKDFSDKMTSKKLLQNVCEYHCFVKDANKQGILLLSDWHYGMDIDNYFNTYNPEICRQRVSKLRDEVISIGIEQKITKLYVVNLSDLIAGRIHLTIRLESRRDVISQVMEVSEILAELLSDLSNYFDIVYTDVMDNHSRLEPNKKDSLELETLVRIIPWYLKERLADFSNILFIENTFADDIAAFKVFDFNVVAVHGHKDKPNKVIENLSAMTRRRNDLVLSAHFHHFSSDEEHETMRVSNGSLMGTDTYAQDLRLTNKPSQTLIISTPNNIVKYVCKINL